MIDGDSGAILNQETGRPFSDAATCVEKEPAVAYQEAASTQARADVRGLLKQVFASKSCSQADTWARTPGTVGDRCPYVRCLTHTSKDTLVTMGEMVIYRVKPSELGAISDATF